MAHHYLQFYGIGEKHAQIHFDNAAGQNKNNCVIWYAVWRTLIGLHETIALSMLVAGHTKFAPDWHFGVWKVKWRDSNAETMTQVAGTVRESSRGGHNVPQLVDDTDKPVAFDSWKPFLEQYFKPVKQLSKYHHFFCSSVEPGVVYCKEYFDSEEVSVNILKQVPEKNAMPVVKAFPGLNAARQWYLYEQIGQFCKSDLAKDVVCPKPCVPKIEIKLDTDCDVKVGGKRRNNLLT
ncbi:uncharacterized protein LOC128556374 [Mercenaria mercenaria]|uniref:uncharacterized protein LOC128556374 n=1 Tax=Mercenaria mercenaria TaxID=6596 RepID=UPI00234ED104|nr:uncharacterized protein LOC128556374 [Mercenaria mercenaria]XP_053397261.1 uncharacterized protein LOC128556374 [Mercenaria mercenaria]